MRALAFKGDALLPTTMPTTTTMTMTTTMTTLAAMLRLTSTTAG